MGFEFGSVAHLDVQVTLVSFVCVILFIIIFDMGTGILEYFLEGSKLYGKIVQTIYKELMLMGLVSFIIVISEGAQTTAVSNSTTGHDWFQAVDFSHMLLFFVTFFFVIHALYLLRSSIIAGNKYKYMFGLTTTELIESIEHVNKYSLSKFFYEFDFLPLSSIREKVEFRLIYIVFRDAYSLPEDFHFAYYLSGCFDRYALRTTNRSMVTWVILILLAICNFVRIALDIGFSSCSSVGDDDVTTGNSTDISHHRLLFEDRDDHLRRLSGSTASTGHVGYESNMCRSNLVKLFLLAGLLLCLYCLIIVFFSRLYKLRIIRKTGLRNTDDYYDFLKFVAEEEERMKLSIKNEEIHKRELRKRNRALKMDIEHVLDDDEAGGEEAEFKEIAEFLARSYSDIRDFISDSILSIRLLIYSITSSKATEGKTGLLQQLQNVSDSAIEVEKDNNETNQEVREGEKTSDDHQNPAPGQRKAMLHLHRSSTRQSHDFGGNGGAFFKQVQTRVMNGKDDILKRLTVSKSTPSSHNASMSKIQPDPSEGPSSLSAANENSLSSNSSPRGSEKTLIQRQRSTTINVQSILSKSGRRSMTPVQGPAAKAGLTRLAGKRNSTVLDSSVVAFLNSQLNAQPAANSTTQGNAGGRGGGPRRGSVVLQKLNAAHNAVQNELSSPTEATKGTDFENAPLADNDLGLIQRYRIYRSGRKKNRMGTVNSVSSITPIMQAGSSSSKMDRPSESFQDRVFNWIDRISAWMGQRQVTKQKSTNSSSKVGKDLESGEKRSETEEDSLMVESLDDFSDIYLFRSAVFFYRSVEMCIMFNCLYFAFWMTDFAVIASWIEQPNFWKISTEIGMIIPAFVLFPCVGSIAETCSMIGALSQLNLEVIHEVLLEAENTRLLMIDLRKKMLARIKALETTNANVVDTVHQLFDEVDEKKNGWIDKFHFRLLLRTLKLTFSDERFNRLYRAVDSSGDGMIEWAELHELLFGHLDEKEGVVGGGNDGHHRDSLSSDRMSILDTSEKNHIVRSGLTAPAIQEEDEDDDDSDSDEEEEEDEEADDDDERSSRSAFSRKNSRYSNPSTKSDRSSGVSSRSPRSSIVRPSSMLKKPKQRKKKSLKPAQHPLVSDATSDNDHDSSTQSIELISLTPVTSLDRKRVTIIEDSMSSNEGDHHHRTIRSLLPNQNEGNMMNTESIHNPLNDPNLSQSLTNSNSNNSNNSHHSNQSIGRIIQHLLQDQHRTTSEGSMSMFSNISEETIE